MEDERKIALYFNWVSGLLSISFVFFPIFYMFQLFLVLLIPVAAVYLVKKFNGVLNITVKNKKIPIIVLGLFFVAVVIPWGLIQSW